MGPLILSIASSGFGRAHCAAARHSSLVTRRLSVVGCCSSLFVVVGPTSAGPIGPNELPRSLRDTPRPFPHFLLASLWTSCASSDQPLDVQAFSRRCHECVNRRPHAYRTRRSVHVDGSGRARRTTPTALGDHDRFPQFLLASLWTSWVRSAQTVDPSRFCRIGRINGSRCRSMPRVPARRAFDRTPLAGFRASAHRIAAVLVHTFCGQACGHLAHSIRKPLIRRYKHRRINQAARGNAGDETALQAPTAARRGARFSRSSAWPRARTAASRPVSNRAGAAAFSTIFVGKLVDRLSIGHSTP